MQDKVRKIRRSSVRKIVSGGQTGADRAALDFAIENNFDYGGFVPKGRIAEDGRIPDMYEKLIETDSAEYEQRTELNVINSDATLIVSHGDLRGGSLFTKNMAEKHGKPYLHIDFNELSIEQASAMVRAWLEALRCKVLNVAGSRSSLDPRIYQKTKDLLSLSLLEY